MLLQNLEIFILAVALSGAAPTVYIFDKRGIENSEYDNGASKPIVIHKCNRNSRRGKDVLNGALNAYLDILQFERNQRQWPSHFSKKRPTLLSPEVPTNGFIADSVSSMYPFDDNMKTKLQQARELLLAFSDISPAYARNERQQLKQSGDFTSTWISPEFENNFKNDFPQRVDDADIFELDWTVPTPKKRGVLSDAGYGSRINTVSSLAEGVMARHGIYGKYGPGK